MTSKSKVSPGIFIASILCFLFPFITVSCGGQKVASFSGVQLATGTTVEQPQMFGPPQKQQVNPEPTVAIAGLCAVLGLGLSFLGSRIAIAPAIAGAAGTLSLLLMKARMDDQIVKEGHGMLQVDYEMGYSLVLLLLFAGAAWNAYLFWQRRRIAPLGQVPAPESLAARGHPAEAKQVSSTETGAEPLLGSALTLHAGGPTKEIDSTSRAVNLCSNCGEPRATNAKFCPKCGKPAGSSTAIMRE